MLRIVSHTSCQFDTQIFLNSVCDADAVLFIQNGVSMAVSGNSLLLSIVEKGASIYALRDDLEARGLLPFVSAQAISISYEQFVDLTVENKPQILW